MANVRREALGILMQGVSHIAGCDLAFLNARYRLEANRVIGIALVYER